MSTNGATKTPSTAERAFWFPFFLPKCITISTKTPNWRNQASAKALTIHQFLPTFTLCETLAATTQEKWDLSAGLRPQPICILIPRLWPKHTVGKCLDSRLCRQETMTMPCNVGIWPHTSLQCVMHAASFRITITEGHTSSCRIHSLWKQGIHSCPQGLSTKTSRWRSVNVRV